MRALVLITFLFLIGCKESSNRNFDSVKKTTVILNDAIVDQIAVDEWPAKNELAEIDEPIPNKIINDARAEFRSSLKEVFDTTDIEVSPVSEIKKISHIGLSDDVRAYQILVSDPKTNFGSLFYGVYNQDWYNHYKHSFQSLAANFQTDFISKEIRNDTVNLVFRYLNEGYPETYVATSYKLTDEGLLWFETVRLQKNK